MAAYWNLLPILLQFLAVVKFQNAQNPASNVTKSVDPKVADTQQVYLYRLINWCIVGRGEYTLNEWPLSQFKPILHQTHKNELTHQQDIQKKIDEVAGANTNPWDKYDLLFSPISCSEMTDKGLGDGKGNCLQRIHIKFKPKSQTDVINFQGLLIQAVHAPFGLGFPFGVFDTDNEFTCSDCKHFKYSRIVGCISRPDISVMHPTVALYHYKLRGKETAEPEPGADPQSAPVEIEREYSYQSELHWNFKWANLPCSSSQIVEFWVLMVLDFERRAWTIKKFGPYNFTSFEYATPLINPTPISVSGIDLLQPGLPTPIIPDCHPFEINPIVVTKDGRPRSCFRIYRSYDPDRCERWERLVRKSNKTTGPSVNNLLKNMMICDANEVTPTAVTGKTRIRVAGDFDVQCTRRYPGKFFENAFMKVKRQPHKICPEWQGRMTCDGKHNDLQFDLNIQEEGSADAKRAFPFSHCVTCKPVTEQVTHAPSDEQPFFKRQEHGVLMIYAFFFFNPVSLNIARFYKETLHEKQCKGWRLWLVIHVGFALFASIFSYLGYTYPTFTELDAHITLGYGAMIGVSSGVLTGWFRHKTSYLNSCMVYTHALSGYLGWGLAIASMVFAPFISKWTRFVSYMASGICLVAMLIMSLHICSVDAKVGMRPKRSHFPVIEIRFDDIIPPRSLCRKIFLYFYIFMQFLICFGMLVL